MALMIHRLRAKITTEPLGKLLVLLLLLILVCPIGFFAYLAFLNDNPDQNFWFVPFPPVPPYAQNYRHFEGSLPGSRTIQFETDQAAEKIQQFYRIELPKRGWYLLCSPTQVEQSDCPLGLSPVDELADAYKRDDDPSMLRAIDVTIYKPGVNLIDRNKRVVEVIEYRYLLPAP
jgi:hypothetical protein